MGQTRKMGQLAIATASVYFHIFFAKLSLKVKDPNSGKWRGFDRHEVAATCLFLAGKVEERPQRVSNIVDAYYLALNASSKTAVPKRDSREFDHTRKQIEALERTLLDVIGFNFSVKHPYTILITYFNLLMGPKYANKTSEWQHKRPGSPLQVAWFYVNDSLRSTACLQYPPDSIAVAAILMTLQNKRIDIKKCPALRTKELAECAAANVPPHPERPWFKELFNKDQRDLDAIGLLIRKVIQPASAPVSSAPSSSSAHQTMVANVQRRRQSQQGGSSGGGSGSARAAATKVLGRSHASNPGPPPASSRRPPPPNLHARSHASNPGPPPATINSTHSTHPEHSQSTRPRQAHAGKRAREPSEGDSTREHKTHRLHKSLSVPVALVDSKHHYNGHRANGPNPSGGKGSQHAKPPANPSVEVEASSSCRLGDATRPGPAGGDWATNTTNSNGSSNGSSNGRHGANCTPSPLTSRLLQDCHATVGSVERTTPSPLLTSHAIAGPVEV